MACHFSALICTCVDIAHQPFQFALVFTRDLRIDQGFVAMGFGERVSDGAIEFVLEWDQSPKRRRAASMDFIEDLIDAFAPAQS